MEQTNIKHRPIPISDLSKEQFYLMEKWEGKNNVLCANVEEKMLLQDFREALQNYPFQKQEGAN